MSMDPDHDPDEARRLEAVRRLDQADRRRLAVAAALYSSGVVAGVAAALITANPLVGAVAGCALVTAGTFIANWRYRTLWWDTLSDGERARWLDRKYDGGDWPGRKD